MPALKLTQKRRAAILAAIAGGASYSGAARSAGIDPKTLYRWRRSGQEGDRAFSSFAEALAKTEAELEMKLIKVWTEAAAAGDWRAASAFLARRFPQRWSNRGFDDEDRATEQQPAPPKPLPGNPPHDHFKILRIRALRSRRQGG